MMNFGAQFSDVIAEVLTIAVVFTIGWFVQRHRSTWLSVAARGVGHVVCQREVLVTLIGLLAFGTSATLSLLGRMPEPSVHDEFSYLLAADTFANGRLSNPTHPLWVHFESFHIIQAPTYASKYPPAQGLMLALGQVIGEHPIVGVWISTGLACAAICWMLLAWLPPRWAALGGLLAALHPGMLMVWSQSYWGGTVAALGGALLLGAWRRIVRRPRLRYALLLGVGLAVLANSRPYEGLLVSLPMAVALLVWMLGKNGPMARVAISRIVLPILAILVVTGGAMGFYNWRVTGNLLRTPYHVYEDTYAPMPLFLWQPPRPMQTYRHAVMRDFYLFADYLFKEQRSLQGLAWMGWHKVKTYWTFYQGGRYLRLVLTIPLILLPWLLRDQWSRFALLTCGVLAVGLFIEPWMHPHYAAPITGLVVMLVLQALWHLSLWRWRDQPVGRLLVCAILVVAYASFIAAWVQHIQHKWSGWQFERARILSELKADGARHLVIVRYGPQHQPNNEWVYNEADIDGASVVWAREMDLSQTGRLLEYFKDRQVWLAEINDDQIRQKLVPFPVEAVR
jgi:hypothetical protein